MKNLIVLISLVLGFANTAFAGVPNNQPPVNNTVVSKIEVFNINHSFLEASDMGSISIDKMRGTITLNLNTMPKCGINEFCVPHAPEVIKLPMVNTFVDSCGATHYVAREDNTPVDGPLETLEVVDYSTMLCEIFIPHLTKTTYRSFNPWTQQTTESSFHGGILERLMFIPTPQEPVTHWPLPLPEAQ